MPHPLRRFSCDPPPSILSPTIRTSRCAGAIAILCASKSLRTFWFTSERTPVVPIAASSIWIAWFELRAVARKFDEIRRWRAAAADAREIRRMVLRNARDELFVGNQGLDAVEATHDGMASANLRHLALNTVQRNCVANTQRAIGHENGRRVTRTSEICIVARSHKMARGRRASMRPRSRWRG